MYPRKLASRLKKLDFSKEIFMFAFNKKRWYSFIESYSPKLIYRQLLTIYREFKLKTFLIYSLKIDINISGVSNSIICLIFPNILTVSSIAYLPVAISNSYLNWFKGLRVSCITFSRLLSAEC